MDVMMKKSVTNVLADTGVADANATNVAMHTRRRRPRVGRVVVVMAMVCAMAIADVARAQTPPAAPPHTHTHPPAPPAPAPSAQTPPAQTQPAQTPPTPTAPVQTPSAQMPDTPPLTLDALEQMAMERNPTLRQAAAGVDAARGRATQAGLLPNPTIGYEAEALSGRRPGPSGEHGFFVEQTIPLGGRRRLGREVFTREADRALALVDRRRLAVRTDVRRLYRDALVAQRRVEVRERLAQLASEAVTVSAQLYNVGAADKPDTLESEIEGRRAQLALVMAQNERMRVWRELGAVVGDPALTPRPLAGSLDAVPELDRDEALKRILGESPDIRVARAAIERAQSAVGLAKRERSPDLVVRAAPRYNRERADDLRPEGWNLSLEAGVVVPLFDRNQGGRVAADADLRAAQAELQRVELAIASRFAVSFDQYLSARRAVDLYRTDVLPRAEQAYQLYLASYQQMAAAYPQVLIAQRTLFQSTDEYLDAVQAAWRGATIIEGLLVDGGLQAGGEAAPDADVAAAARDR